MRTCLAVWFLCAALCAPARADSLDFKLPSGEVMRGTHLEELELLRAQVARVRAAARAALGVEIGRVPVHVVTLEALRVLHAEVGGRLPPRWSLGGFELDGHVFVRRALGGIPDEVLIHECLHAISRRFSDEAHQRGIGKLVEGTTQYFTLRALAARPSAGLVRERSRVYVAFTHFADALATLVGEAAFKAAYFGAGFARLAEQVDAQRRRPAVLVQAARALEGGDEQEALSLLTGP